MFGDNKLDLINESQPSDVQLVNNCDYIFYYCELVFTVGQICALSLRYLRAYVHAGIHT